MGPDLHPRRITTLRSRDVCRRRAHWRAHIRAITARQLGRGADYDQGSAILNELHGQ